jgi:5-(carboxyamino)imidazole ribonucleotide mutase
MIAIVLGSQTDLPVVQDACDLLKRFKIPYEIRIISAHRSPKVLHRYITRLEAKGIRVVIGVAGGAAHLPGVIASLTHLPVIGVPVQTKAFKGIDSLLSIIQMPSGVPVATVSVGSAGAKNAAILAAQILALGNKTLSARIKRYKKGLSREVQRMDQRLKDYEG